MALYSNADPVSALNYYNVNGCQISNDTTTPNTVLDMQAGQARDSTNTYDLSIGNYLGSVPANVATQNSVTLLSTATTGVNALDTGTVAASKLYYIYLIGDATGKYQTQATMSLNGTAPALPAGYNVYRHIGQRSTNSSSNLILAYDYGNGSSRVTMFDVPQATAVTAGHATTFTNVNLAALVPARGNVLVWLYVSYTPATAGNTANLQPGNGVGNSATITGQVATVASTQIVPVMAQLVTIGGVLVPVINYKLANAGDAIAISVAGFEYSLL